MQKLIREQIHSIHDLYGTIQDTSWTSWRAAYFLVHSGWTSDFDMTPNGIYQKKRSRNCPVSLTAQKEVLVSES